MNLDFFWRYSEEEAIKHDKFKNSRFFFILDDITEVSDDLLENSVMSDHSKDTTVASCYRFSCYYRFSDIAINSVNPSFI